MTSYHNHTQWSDGATNLAEMIEGALRAGLSEMGMSDHYTLAPPGLVVEWSMPLDRLGEYVAELQEAAARTQDLTVRIGVEADFFPETVNELRDRLAPYPFDYVIGSIHYVDGFPLDETKEIWDQLSTAEVNEVWAGYWDRVEQMAASEVYDFAGHLDLPKKFVVTPTEDMSERIERALQALARHRMAMEINTAGWHKPCNEAYPSPAILRQASELGIDLVINADAHHPNHLTRDFDRAYSLARECGFTSVVRFEGRQRIPTLL